MKFVRNLAILAACMTLPACNGAFWGNLVVLGMTISIFFATISIGRRSGEATRSAEASASSGRGQQ